jgi:hypothetical protein
MGIVTVHLPSSVNVVRERLNYDFIGHYKGHDPDPRPHGGKDKHRTARSIAEAIILDVVHISDCQDKL